MSAFVSLLVVGCTSSSDTTTLAPRLQTTRVAAFTVASATVRVLPGLDSAYVGGMNDSDVVVGSLGQSTRPFRWDAVHGLQYLPGVLPGTDYAIASAISDAGVIGGTIGAHAWLWETNGVSRPFGLPADSSNYGECGVNGINQYGSVVGWCNQLPSRSPNASNFVPAIFLWHAPAADVSYSGQYNAISKDDWIAGGSAANILGPAFLVSPTHEVLTLTNHYGAPSFNAGATAVTQHGWAAGYDSAAHCAPPGQAVAWLSAPNTVRPEFRMGTCGQSNGITDDWYVVGTGVDSVSSTTSQFAFVWFPGPGTQRLPGLGGTNEYSQALAINAQHHVLGIIVSSGVRHVVIWQVGPR
jgi:hypothetical protein